MGFGESAKKPSETWHNQLGSGKCMKQKKKDEVFFVKETPEDYDIDYHAKPLTKAEMEKLLAPAKKKGKSTKGKRAA